jgi:hypothetical protein
MSKRLVFIFAFIGVVSIGLFVLAQGTPPQDGAAVTDPRGLVLNFAVGPLTENDVFLPKYLGEIPYKVMVHVQDNGRGIQSLERSVHVYPGRKTVRREALQGGYELVWTIMLSVDTTRADAFFQLHNADQIVLSQSIAVQLPGNGG